MRRRSFPRRPDGRLTPMALALVERGQAPPVAADDDPSPLTLAVRAFNGATACRAGLKRGSLHPETVQRMERLFTELHAYLARTDPEAMR